MRRTENIELTVVCLISDKESYLLQDRIKEDWRGYTLPGGHVEAGESIVDAVVREMREETGLTVLNPKLCGVKQFPTKESRYIVFLFPKAKAKGKSKVADSDKATKEELLQYLTEEEYSDKILEIFNSYKTRVAINNGLSKEFRDSQKSSAIYKKLKTLLKEKQKS